MCVSVLRSARHTGPLFDGNIKGDMKERVKIPYTGILVFNYCKNYVGT